jgi:hypothetical protein
MVPVEGFEPIYLEVKSFLLVHMSFTGEPTTHPRLSAFLRGTVIAVYISACS